MMIRRVQTQQRSGAAIVETAMVLPVVLMMLFGIFEYGRFVFVYTTATNAVRDGCRYAVAHTGSTTTTLSTIQTVVDNKMAGLKSQMAGYAVTCYFADPAKLALTPPVVAQHPVYTGTNDWQKASYGDKIAVVMTGTYRPTMAQLLALGSGATFNLRLVSLMTSEGN